MKRVIAIILFISQFGYIYGDIVKDFQNAVEGCCQESYKEDQANHDKCVAAIQQGLKGGPVEKSFDKLSAGVRADVKIGWVSIASQRLIAMCKHVAELIKSDAQIITAETFGFIMASGFNSLDENGYKGFTQYITAEGKKGQDKIAEITSLKTSYYQYLFGCSSDAFDKFYEYRNDLFSDGFKQFLQNYYDCFFDEKEKHHNLQQCTTYQIITTYKTVTTTASNFNELIKPEITKCQKTNAKAQEEEDTWET